MTLIVLAVGTKGFTHRGMGEILSIERHDCEDFLSPRDQKYPNALRLYIMEII